MYKVLGVSKEASQDDIRKSYRKLARKYHPDANPEDPKAEGRFKEIQQAYEVLSSPEKRREYDQGPREYFGGAGGGGRQPGSTGRAGGAGGDFSDLFGGFGDIFGRSTGNRSAARKGQDVTVSVNLKFEDALRGLTTRVSAPVEEVCGDCRGTGAAPGTAPRTCPDCGGRGMKSQDQGFFAFSGPCSRCGGNGTVVEKPCPACAGKGRVRRTRQVTVKIPAGAREGTKIRVPGRGGAGSKGGPAGDLYVVTRVAEHPVFERRGDDFVAEVPVSFVEAALGSEIEVPRPPGGTVKLRLPAGTQNGKQLKVRGGGAPKTRGEGAGDLIVKVRVAVPEKLNRREKEILEAFADERDEDVRGTLFKKAGL